MTLPFETTYFRDILLWLPLSFNEEIKCKAVSTPNGIESESDIASKRFQLPFRVHSHCAIYDCSLFLFIMCCTGVGNVVGVTYYQHFH